MVLYGVRVVLSYVSMQALLTEENALSSETYAYKVHWIVLFQKTKDNSVIRPIEMQVSLSFPSEFPQPQGVPTGAIIAGILCVIFLVALIATAIVMVRKRQRKNRE